MNIKIDTDNAAFEDNQDELQEILHNVADLLTQPSFLRDPQLVRIRDGNGNTVGTIEVTP